VDGTVDASPGEVARDEFRVRRVVLYQKKLQFVGYGNRSMMRCTRISAGPCAAARVSSVAETVCRALSGPDPDALARISTNFLFLACDISGRLLLAEMHCNKEAPDV
jgi:hypothetical protein